MKPYALRDKSEIQHWALFQRYLQLVVIIKLSVSEHMNHWKLVGQPWLWVYVEFKEGTILLEVESSCIVQFINMNSSFFTSRKKGGLSFLGLNLLFVSCLTQETKLFRILKSFGKRKQSRMWARWGGCGRNLCIPAGALNQSSLI